MKVYLITIDTPTHGSDLSFISHVWEGSANKDWGKMKDYDAEILLAKVLTFMEEQLKETVASVMPIPNDSDKLRGIRVITRPQKTGT